MTLFGVSTIRFPVRKVPARVAGPCCSRRAPCNGSKKYQSTVAALIAPPKPQLQPGQRDSLLYLLRPHVAKKVSLDQGADAYVSIKELVSSLSFASYYECSPHNVRLQLNHPEFRHLDIGSLQDLTDTDEKFRFLFQYDVNSEKDHWWVRAKRWNVSYTPYNLFRRY